MAKKIVLIIPPLLGGIGDPFGSIPSLPVGVPYLASYLRKEGFIVAIIDAFGLMPLKKTIIKNKFVSYGLTINEIISKIPTDVYCIGISVHSGSSHSFTQNLISVLRSNDSFRKKLIVVGGAQPTFLYNDFIKSGADAVILGEGEESFTKLLNSKRKDWAKIDGIAYTGHVNPKLNFIKDLDELPFPAINLLPLNNYWKLGYAHGPVKGRYTFLITSRGCPLNCSFCAAPGLWQRKWRVRSPKNVVDEIEYFSKKYNIRDFHIQDDNFTFDKVRCKEVCNEIINRKLNINWKLPAGMKIETVDEETITLMAKSGCNYVSFSPETGSKRVLDLMNKRFNHEYALKMASIMHKRGIKLQACFVLGFPGENNLDRIETTSYIKKLVKAGVDEIGLFIMTPLPGANAYSTNKFEFDSFEELNFSPRYRKDYEMLNKFRTVLYLKFLFYRLLYHPLLLFKQGVNVFTGNFETKMEMTVYRMFKTYFTR